MATAFAAHPAHAAIPLVPAIPTPNTREPGPVANFVHDLIEHVAQKPLQAAEFAKHDMFREHINAMSISYFALIVLLIGASVPMLVFLVPMLTQ